MIEARHFVQDFDIHPFVRLQANGQLVLRQLLPGFFKQVHFRVFEVDHHFRTLGRQTLAGAQVERHARPAPVVDIDADRNESFRIAGFVGALFFQVARHFFALHKAGSVLAAHGFFAHVGMVDAAQRTQHFDFFIANAVGAEIGRR